LPFKEMIIVKSIRIGKGIVAAVFVVLLCLIGVGSGFAAEGTVKIATMSLPEILSKSTAGQEARRQLEDKVVEFQTKIQQEQEKQDGLRSDIEKKSSIWSEEVRQEKERDLLKMGQELKLMSEDAQFELQKLEKKIMAPILKELHEVIAEVGKQQSFTLIFENTNKGLESRSGLLYSDEALDISDLVREALEKRLAAQKGAN